MVRCATRLASDPQLALPQGLGAPWLAVGKGGNCECSVDCDFECGCGSFVKAAREAGAALAVAEVDLTRHVYVCGAKRPAAGWQVDVKCDIRHSGCEFVI